MKRKRSEIIDCLAAEWRSLEALIRGLTPDDLDHPTRCEAFSVRDVAAHSAAIVSDIPAGTTGKADPQQEAAVRRGRTAEQLADEIAEAAPAAEALLRRLPDEIWDGPSPIAGLSVGRAVEAGILEAVVHADDIRAALGRLSERSFGLTVSIEHVAARLEERGWGPRTIAPEGMQPIDVDGGGDPIGGDPWAFLLAATGRATPAGLGLDDAVNIFA
ncbi:MAG TPA: maleylpyruvate isomerase family mycothiol-dependent enzyme [Actinomycetota bacterium]|nr:maleylpyruvate isomerase family mycothiol-dependent enzyme [Actinomycetota bacterium]